MHGSTYFSEASGLVSSDDIIEIKPGIGPFTLNIRALLRRLSEKKKHDPVSIVARRFLTLFGEHGITVSQIPRILPQLSLEQLRDTDSLLRALTTDILAQTASFFGVRLAWLEGVDDRLYEMLTCYKQPEVFFQECARLNLPDIGFAVRALCAKKELDWRDDRHQPIALILVDKLQDLGEQEITRYRVFADAWDWSHTPCRVQLKATARLVLQKYGRPLPLHQVKSELLQEIIEGRRIPRSSLKGCLLTNPSLEDFAMSGKESVQAKETAELPEVLRYVSGHGLEDLARKAFQRGDL